MKRNKLISFADYISKEKRAPLAYWVDFSTRNTGHREAVLYGRLTGGYEECLIAVLVNVAREIEVSSKPEIAKMTPDEYIKKRFKCRMLGNVDPNAKYCVVFYGDDKSMKEKGVLPLPSLKGCENEIKKCVANLFGAEITVEKLHSSIIRSLEM